MSHRKTIGYCFPLLKIHICFEDVMCTRACWKSEGGGGGGSGVRAVSEVYWFGGEGEESWWGYWGGLVEKVQMRHQVWGFDTIS